MNDSSSGVLVRSMSSLDIPAAMRLFGAIAAETNAEDTGAAEEGQAGLRQSLAHYDITESSGIWVLLAELEGKLVGYALAVRIPKLDHRIGFVFVDELYVLRAYRRRGVARELLDAVHGLARRDGYAGVRLLVRPSNAAARALYRRLDYTEHEAILCELWEMSPRREALSPSA
jgi:ribosomal protein S18 acetylase RimI-like enzyme